LVGVDNSANCCGLRQIASPCGVSEPCSEEDSVSEALPIEVSRSEPHGVEGEVVEAEDIVALTLPLRAFCKRI